MWGGGGVQVLLLWNTCLKVPKGWVGVFRYFRKLPMALFCHKKERAQAIFEKYHGTF